MSRLLFFPSYLNRNGSSTAFFYLLLLVRIQVLNLYKALLALASTQTQLNTHSSNA